MTELPEKILETPILIVGGGPVGFALALDLSVRGTRSVLVEREAGTALELLAKASILNERTMEYCRWLGISTAVANAGFPEDCPRDTIFCTSLNGFEIGRVNLPSAKERPLPEQTPEILRSCPQHWFDPLLADTVIKRGMTDVLYSTSLIKISQDETGVLARLAGAEGKRLSIRAQYLVGCDGAGSSVRNMLGIPFEGNQLDYSVSVMLSIKELERYHPYGQCERFLFIGPDGTWANLTSIDGRELWRLTLVGSEEKLDPDRLDVRAVMRRVLGRDDVPYEVLRVVPWRRSQYVAARLRDGRVLLAGDSSHTMSPTGGHGLNTGLGDAADLGWMLDALVRGWGGAGLLEAYDTERRSVAVRNGLSSTRNYAAWVQGGGRDRLLDDDSEGQAQRAALGVELDEMLYSEWHSLGIGLGYNYGSSPLIIPDGTEMPPDHPSVYIQTARPGHRAPHAWLPDGRSTLDLFGSGFTLLSFGSDVSHSSAIRLAARRAKVPLVVETIQDPGIASLYESKLVLVRPDGMVAWRADTAPENPALLIDQVCGNATG